jgi:integrase
VAPAPEQARLDVVVDFLIIGNGMFGAATARYLAPYATVTVVGREARADGSREYGAHHDEGRIIGDLSRDIVWSELNRRARDGMTLGRFWNAARDAAGLPEGFTPYNARHTGISWAIDKGVDLQKVRQRAGHGSLEVTSPYAAILDERDTSLADALEEIFI